MKSYLFIKRILIPIFIGLTTSLFFIWVPQAFATPPTSPYAPGETRDPTCSPGGTNCTVTAPAVSGANSDITSLSGLTTALSAAQGGTGQSTYTKGDLLVGSSTTVLTKLTVGGNGTFLQSSSTAPNLLAYSKINLSDSNSIEGLLGVAYGGTGLSSGTSGGIPYFSASNAISSSAALASGYIVSGGGAGGAPATGAASITFGSGGAEDQILTFNASTTTDMVLKWDNTNSRADLNKALSVGDSGISTFNQGLIVNEAGGATSDDIFRVEGDTEANLIYADAANNKVGIATTTPASLLTVNGDLRVYTSSTLGNVISGVWNGTAIADAYIASADTWNNKQSQLWGLSGSNLFASSTSWNVGIGTTTPSGILTVASSSSGTALLTILPSGNVGIGTNTPGAKLEVAGDIAFWGGGGAGSIRGTLTSPSWSSDSIAIRGGYDGAGGITFQTRVGTFQDRLTIINNGNIGIATTTPSEVLTINGGLFVGTSTVGIPTLYVASTTGRVGIGTNTPSGFFEAINLGGGAFPSSLTLTEGTLNYSDANGATIRVAGGGGREIYMAEDGAGTIDLQSVGGTLNINRSGNSINIGNGDLFISNAAGSIGIGTTTPSHALTINGGLWVGTSTSPILYVASTTGTVDIGVGSTYALVTDLLGRVGVGTTTPATQLQVVGTSTTWAILPEANSVYSLGSASFKWANLYAATTTVGDLAFGNDFRITEEDSSVIPQALIFKNHRGEEIMRLDENGNMILAGSIASSSTQSTSTQSISTESVSSILSGFFDNLFAKVKEILASLGLVIENGIAQLKELIADRITTKELCVDDICINKAQLKELLEKNQITNNVASLAPVCDSGHLDLCVTQELCEGVSLYWYNETCNSASQEVSPPAADVCDSAHFNLCSTQTDCETAAGYWYNDICNAEAQTEPEPEPEPEPESEPESADTTAPVIALIGDTMVNINVGDAYIDAGATASDDVDGDISVNIAVANSVDASAAGTYAVTYNVSDTGGNAAAEVIRTVNVLEVVAPQPEPEPEPELEDVDGSAGGDL